ncbi:MAG TPA: exopolyphosphatase, partial [Nocardioides sp.]|nr:exopolyphosphatase [Nocardioides sp.]
MPEDRGARGPVAAIDCGTNTIKLLIGALPDVAVRETRIVRLGQGVDATGRLADEALERTFAALDEYAALVREHEVTRMRFCATSATRDADNAAIFTAGVRERLGVDPEVLSGLEEAELAYAGAVRHLREDPALPVLVVDIGGGSTELIRGASLTAPPSAAHSMDIGSVRLHERHLRSDPPSRDELTACVADIERHLDACPVSPARAATVVGVAGTVTTVAAGALDLTTYDAEVVDQAALPVTDVHAVAARLVGMTV